MSGEARAILVAALLVVLAAVLGGVAGQRARPAPPPRPTSSATVAAVPTAPPPDPAETQRRAFAQPLSAGCATANSVWIVADGGAAIRWDGRAWTIPDPTLRSLVAAQCDRSTVLAVGGGGSLLTVDEEARSVRADRFGTEDLTALARVPGGAVAVGLAGTIIEQGDLGWRSVPAGVTRDLHGVAVTPSASGATGWVVGGEGAAYRFADGRWDRVDTGTRATLRAVAQTADLTVAVGDEAHVLRYAAGEWRTILSDPQRPGAIGRISLRAVAVVGRSLWAVGDRGFVIEIRVTASGHDLRPVDLGTACTLRSVFTEGSAVWVVGSDGTRGGAWRIAPGGTDRWGTC